MLVLRLTVETEIKTRHGKAVQQKGKNRACITKRSASYQTKNVKAYKLSQSFGKQQCHIKCMDFRLTLSVQSLLQMFL